MTSGATDDVLYVASAGLSAPNTGVYRGVRERKGPCAWDSQCNGCSPIHAFSVLKTPS